MQWQHMHSLITYVPFHAFAQQWGKCYSDMDETIKELFRNNSTLDLLKTMFSREDGTISVELVKTQYRKS